MIKEQAKEQARKLYMQSGLSQQQIAGDVGVNPRTLYGWIREGDWKRARKAALALPLMLLEQNYIQFVSMNEDILSREERPYPTKEEADIMRKLSATIKQLKEPGIVTFADTTQALMQFSMYLRKRDKDMSMKVVRIMNDYVDDIRPDKRSLMTMYDEKEEIMNAQTDPPLRHTPTNETPVPAEPGQQTNVQPDTPPVAQPDTPPVAQPDTPTPQSHTQTPQPVMPTPQFDTPAAVQPDTPPAAQPDTPAGGYSNNDIGITDFHVERVLDKMSREAEKQQQILARIYKEYQYPPTGS